MTKVEGYQTSDGKFHIDEQEACEHQKKLDIKIVFVDFINQVDGYFVFNKELEAVINHHEFDAFVKALYEVNESQPYAEHGLPSLKAMRETMGPIGDPQQAIEVTNKMAEYGYTWNYIIGIPER